MKNKGKFKIDLNPVSGSRKWFDFKRLEVIEKSIQNMLENSHLEKLRVGIDNYKKSLKTLRGQRTRLRNKYLIGQVIEIDFKN